MDSMNTTPYVSGMTENNLEPKETKTRTRSRVKLDTKLSETAKHAKLNEELDWRTETDMENDYE